MKHAGFRKLSLMFVSFVAALSVSCQTSPRGRKQFMIIPADQMDSMGIQAFADLKSSTKIEKDPAMNTYVKCVANAITDAMPEKRQWEVVVFKDDSANAFALPGGKIGVHTGLLKVATNADQLAAVLGHEVGHVIAQHGNERVSEQIAAQGGLGLISAAFSDKNQNYGLIMAGLGVGAQFGLLKFSRTHESEADLIGLDLMARAGFDPRQSIELWKNMSKEGGGQPPEFLSTHPAHATRISGLEDNMSSAMKIYQQAPVHPSCKL